MSVGCKKVAVIGGGIFGCTTAIELARNGVEVTLYERNKEIMTAASAINQYRLHRGYHYPRSNETILSCKQTTPEFEDAYKDAIVSSHKHFYCIAKEKSFLTGKEYLAVLDAHELPYSVVEPTHVNMDAIDVAVEVEENLFDPHRLKGNLEILLKEAGVTVVLDSEMDVDDVDPQFDFVVVATYAALNNTFKNRGEARRTYQYEVCEKIVIEIPEDMHAISTVVMDGPFMSFDPLGDTGYAVMGHVEHAIHSWNVGEEPDVSEIVRPLLNRGIIKNPPITNARKFLKEGARFMPKLADAKHVGSMFTIRTVLPRVEDTDARPTIVNKVDERVISIYSGKIGNSVAAAKDVCSMILS